MANVLVAIVDVAIMLRQQVDVMKDEAVERVVLQRLHDSSVVESTLVEHTTASLQVQCSPSFQPDGCIVAYMKYS